MVLPILLVCRFTGAPWRTGILAQALVGLKALEQGHRNKQVHLRARVQMMIQLDSRRESARN